MTLPPLLAGQVCAVTGGLTGIGRAITILFLSHGAKVAINYLASHNKDEDQLLTSLRTDAFDAIKARSSSSSSSSTAAAAGAGLHNLEDVPLLTVPGDISLPETGQSLVEQAVAKFGRLDTFVSNAGICKFEEFLDISPELYQSHVSTNLSGAFYAVQAAARQMTRQTPQGGSIIGISSISALVGGAQQCHYTPTKAGILSLMQSTATALGRYNIRCNALLPGTIRTQLNDDDLKDGSDKKQYMEGRIPLGRLGKPDDLAGPALFLAHGELSGYVTGAAILVDGGAFVNFQ
ncbi:L-rhamnose-1-dehydrogenase [Cladophialophora carrionii]|uniref:L-rhamnose-1-dehydrogenase n=1 Tax=Cladophialophora carrionii TaxID=86049 RepID=A0A1C1C750_9EURO|nr:L-rhamnose-1-dehydrogenase [Cladophialophora carrionii]